MCVFNGGLCVWDRILDSHKLFYFFLQHVSLTLFHLCTRKFWQSTFSTDLWWLYKESCFQKHTLSLASFQLEHVPVR